MEQGEGRGNMALILVWSIMTNMVAIFAIVILYVRQNRLIEAESNMRSYTEDLENMITAFLLEIKEENERLETVLLENDGRDDEEACQREERIQGEEKSKPDISVKPDVLMEARENYMLFQVLKAKRLGRSIEEIAKEMGKGKTEIELLIKMNE